MDAVNSILDYAVGYHAAALPPTVAETTKAFVLDTLSLMLAGHRAPGCHATVGLLRRWGGSEEATIIGTNIRLPSHAAALANSLHAHAYDFDDTHERGDMHGYAVVLPAALAVAERVRNVSGPEFLAAVSIGVDVAYRLGLAIKRYRGWHPTATCGIFGAALAAGRIGGLDRAALHNALGIAYSLASGNFQCILDGSLTKRLQPGFAARAAVEAITLAEVGITGAKNVLEGKFGFFPLYEAGEYDREPLVANLGTVFEGQNTSMKPYPSCRFCHAAIDAMLEISRERRLRAEDVESIVVKMPAEAYDYVGKPYVAGDSPQVNAQFSTAYNVAVALIRGRVGLREFDTESLSDPNVCKLAARVKTVAVQEEHYCFGPQDIIVHARDGRSIERRVVVMKGHPDNPMTADERRAKARGCIQYGGFDVAIADGLATWVDSMEQSSNVAAELTALCGERAS